VHDEIELRGLRVMATVGVLEHERRASQPLEIELTLRVDLADAAASDRLDDTVDYGALTIAVEEVVAKSNDLLLERVAGRVAEAVLADARVDAVDVVVRKLRPPVPSPLEHAAVRLHRSQAGRLASDPGAHRAVLALGSNLGDRRANLRLAVRRLGPPVGLSQVYETDPVGGPEGQGAFLNMVVAVDTPLDPFALLRQCQRVEAAAGRRRLSHHGSRTLDVDILFYDDAAIRTAELVVPHPRLVERRFVLAPLSEVAPTLVPPGWDEQLPPLGMRALGRLDLGP
jgi:dihydroneopterin aldolase/2-amino-4-hydroxy-6-hydroxymethyldihydropteridine diphosphokinase